MSTVEYEEKITERQVIERMSEKFEMRRVWDINDSDILSLVARSDEYLSALYPPESNHAEPIDALVGEDSAFFAGYVGEQLAACGAVKLIEDDTTYGEIKRVFVEEAHRGKRLVALRIHSLNTSSAIFDRACVFSQAITGGTAARSGAVGDRTIQ